MMLLAGAAVRCLLLGFALWALLKVLQVRQSQLQHRAWTALLAGALLMPALSGLMAGLAPVHVPLAMQVLSAAPGHAVGRAGVGGWLTLTYGLGAALGVARLLIATARMQGIRRRAVRQYGAWTAGCDVRVTEELAGPVTFGCTILLPAGHEGWSPAKRLAILTHERAHVRNRDGIILWLAALHQSLFWFSPLAWWLRRRLAALAEQISDDAVVAQGFDRCDYAQWLLEAAAGPRALPGAVSMAGGGVAGRIERLLAQVGPEPTPPRWLAGAAMLPVWGLCVLAAMVAPARSLPPTPFGDARITAYPPVEQLRKLYPRRALASGQTGTVVMAVALDGAGHAGGSRIVRESPSGAGFGEAATELARHMAYANPTGRPVVFTFKVAFRPE